MAIQATQRMQNIQASLETYIQTNLVTADGLKVAFEGVPFESRDLQSWVEMSYLSQDAGQKYRHACSDLKGAEVTLLVQFLCFAKRSTIATGKPANKFLMAAIRDALCGRFSIGQEIDIKDHYASGTVSVGTMQVHDFSGNMYKPPVGDAMGKSAQGLSGWVFTVELRYTAIHGST